MMAQSGAESRLDVLNRLPTNQGHQFETPSKKINDGDDLQFFLSSTAYRGISTWLLQLNRSMFPTKAEDGKVTPCDLTSPPAYSSNIINSLRNLLDALAGLIDKAPPSVGPRRFGNVAFRQWYKLADEEAAGLCRTHLLPALESHGADHEAPLINELKSYLLASFGSPQRLDYGTGHELAFLAFLGCLWKLNAFSDGEERAIVMGVIQPYLQLVRNLILNYTLEPAGSHGVWGLDDHSFLPYIFGSAQFGPPIVPDDYSKPVPTEGSWTEAPEPSIVTNKARVADYKDSNMYFSAVQFIYDVKKGPFWEHSPILYDISGLKDGWAKINKGMLKMYAAEVLGKFPVVQHFGFGSLFRWEPDLEAAKQERSVHAAMQPGVAVSKDVPVPASGSGTKAPWVRQGGGAAVPALQSATGLPTARMGPPSTAAPWTTTSRPPPQGGMPSTAAPWASTSRPPAPSPTTGAPSTTAPWAKKDWGR